MTENSDLAAQLERLRRDLFWTKYIAGLVILCLVAVVIAGRPRHPKVVEGTKFVLRNDAGNVIATLGKEGIGSTCLTLSAKEHAATAGLCVDDDGGGFLDIHDLHTDSRSTLTPGFTTYEPLTRFPAGLQIEKDGSKNFVNFSLGDETKVVIGYGSNGSITFSSPRGKPAISLFGEDGKPIWATH